MFGHDGGHADLEGELRQRGEAAMVNISSKVPRVLKDGNVEWTFHVTVQAHGQWQKVEFRQVLAPSLELRYRDLKLPVLFDPDKPSRIVVDMAKLPEAVATAAAATEARQTGIAARDAAETGWKLPDRCPGCGAPVNQAVKSAILDPHCDFCHEPLPVQRNPATG